MENKQISEREIKRNAKLLCQILDMRGPDEDGNSGINARKLYESDDIFQNNGRFDCEEMNIVMIISIIPNSFVLSYLATLQRILSMHFKKSSGQTATINVLFMGDAVILDEGAWREAFSNHYKQIITGCKDDGKDGEYIRNVLMKLKRSEFESFLNMILFSFNDHGIQNAIKENRIEFEFNNLSEKREKLISANEENVGDFTEDNMKIFKNNKFPRGITKVQDCMFFNGGNRAVILEMGRLLDYWIKEDTAAKLVYIATEVFKESIEICYPNLWDEIHENTIWFKDPPMRDNKMLMYLNAMSTHINESNGINFIELEEFYHYEVLTNLNSRLFNHQLDKMQNNIFLGKERYNTSIIEIMNDSGGTDFIKKDLEGNHMRRVRDDLNNFSEFNILQLRSHQMDVINKGFLSVQDEMIKQLDLIL